MILLWILLLVFSVVFGLIQLENIRRAGYSLFGWAGLGLALAVVGFYFACHHLHLLGL